MPDAAKLAEALERLQHVFHEDEPSPLMQPEEDDWIRDDVLALAAAYVALAARPPGDDGWRPMDSAPKNGTEVILCAVLGPLSDMGICYWKGDRWTCGWDKDFLRPTHWRPLPAPPERP